MSCTDRERDRWIADAHRILTLAGTPGLPRPSITPTGFAFNFTSAASAEDAAEDVALAETILTSALGVTFKPAWPDPVGSSRHYMLVAEMPASGLPLTLVAKAQHFGGQDAPVSVPELAAA